LLQAPADDTATLASTLVGRADAARIAFIGAVIVGEEKAFVAACSAANIILF
jgi:hypothetical protein